MFIMRRILFFVLLFSLALGLTACGGGSGPSTTISVTFTDFHFTPDTFVIPAGQEITITAVNNGAVEHDFVIMKYGTTVGADFGVEDQKNIYFEIKTMPGDSIQKTFTAPTDLGEYQIVCGVSGHFMAGMVGKLRVVAP
jgi:uncharacterized cupredoxin-like copper-binding protein